jgi:O-antigen/teichoic acid export membrane protein
LLFKPAEAIDFFFQSKVLSKYTAYSKNVACLASAVAITAAIFQNCSILTIAVLSNLEFAISATLTLIFYLWKGYKLSILSVSWQRAIALLKDSWPLILSGIAIIIYMRIDQVMIKLISGDTELGIYSAAVRLTEAFYLIPTAIVGSTLPKITQASEESKELLYSELQSLYKVVALISYISIFFTSILAKPIISIMYGDDYLASVPILRVLIWTILFVNLGIAQHSFIVIMNWTSLYMKIVFLASLMNILLNYLLIPDYGAIGATIATIFSCWFVTHGACFIYKPLNKTGEMTTKALTLMS